MLNLSPDQMLTEAASWSEISIDRFDSGDEWIVTEGVLDPKVETSFDNRFSLTITTEGVSVREAFFNEDEEFDAPGNFYLTMEALASEQNGCDFGLIFRGTIDGSYYTFFVGRDKYGVSSVLDSERTDIIERTDLPENLGTPNTIAVIGQGDNYKFYVNGEFITEITDNRIDGRRVGIEVLVCQYIDIGNFNFDNFELRQP